MQPYEKHAVLFLLNHLLSGMAGAVVLGIGLLVGDVANLRTLVLSSDNGFISVFLLFAGLMITFGSLAMGIGIMCIGDDPSD